ncbi:MAG: hypothetical protein ACRDQZ_17600 [Mycobacteriales bacterium]
MSLFLSSCPLWVIAILVVILPTVAASWGLIFIRSRFGLEKLSSNNEVAGFKFAVVGVIYAVLLAFAVIVVWERYNDAELAVVQEAGAATTLYRLASGPQPEAVAIRTALANYLTIALERDWPMMAKEQASPEVNQALNELYAAALRLAHSGSLEAAVQVAMFHQLDAITQARRNRLHLALGVVPVVLWEALMLGGVLTVAFTFFFGTANLKAQVLMTAILSLIVFMGLFVIISIDHPFTGPVHVEGVALKRVLHDFAGR